MSLVYTERHKFNLILNTDFYFNSNKEILFNSSQIRIINYNFSAFFLIFSPMNYQNRPKFRLFLAYIWSYQHWKFGFSCVMHEWWKCHIDVCHIYSNVSYWSSQTVCLPYFFIKFCNHQLWLSIKQIWIYSWWIFLIYPQFLRSVEKPDILRGFCTFHFRVWRWHTDLRIRCCPSILGCVLLPAKPWQRCSTPGSSSFCSVQRNDSFFRDTYETWNKRAIQQIYNTMCE